MIGVRLHPLIFSTLLEIPSIAIAYDPKVEAFAEIVAIPCQTLQKLSTTSLLSEVKNLQNNREAIIKKLKNKNEILKRLEQLLLKILKPTELEKTILLEI